MSLGSPLWGWEAAAEGSSEPALECPGQPVSFDFYHSLVNSGSAAFCQFSHFHTRTLKLLKIWAPYD